MWLLVGGVVLAGLSILLFAMISMAKSEERLAREAERELESIVSGAAYGRSPPAPASVRKVEAKEPFCGQGGSRKFKSGDGDRNHQPSEEEALA